MSQSVIRLGGFRPGNESERKNTQSITDHILLNL